ncbi:MAG: HAD family hydrolase [Planctomycetes bacterium]|nr:HAD family hydrolase [Planctomycetota bacterium]
MLMDEKIMPTVIFDIDGTLVDSMGFDDELFREAVITVAGEINIHGDWMEYDFVTDTGIINQILRENNIPDIERHRERIRTRFGELVENHLADNPCQPVSGAVEAIKDLQEDSDYAVGIATGGWGHTARMKLQSAGFELDGIPLCSSDEHYQREAIMELCKNQLAPNNNKTVYVGDREWDQQAAINLGWGFVGVGEKLRGKTSVWIADYASGEWQDALKQALQEKPK